MAIEGKKLQGKEKSRYIADLKIEHKKEDQHKKWLLIAQHWCNLVKNPKESILHSYINK